MLYRMFDLYIDINTKYEESAMFLQKYIEKEDHEPDISIEIEETELEKERTASPENSGCYNEIVCIFRHIAEEISDFDGMFVHSAVLDLHGRGYMFTGKSGAGKSTHVMQWIKYFGNDARVINGDKPVLRFFSDGIYAYGSPWCGVEGLAVNDKVRLHSACFIVQAQENKITKTDATEVFKRILNQTVTPKNPKRRIKHFELMDRLIKDIPFYELECDISENAVKTAYEAMRG